MPVSQHDRNEPRGTDTAIPAANEIDAIVRWADRPHPATPGFRRTPLLRFREDRIEQAFLQWDFERGRTARLIGGTAAVVLVGGLSVLDTTIAPGASAEAVRLTRIVLSIPSALALLVSAIVVTRARRWIDIVTVAFVCYLLRFSILVLHSPNAIAYFSHGMQEGVIGFFLAGHLPLRRALLVSLGSCTAFALAAAASHVAPLVLVDAFIVDSAVIVIASLVLLYRHERASRSEFVAQALSHRSYERRLAAEVDRRRWLEVFAGFLEHELKNAMTGISSSLDLAWRTRTSSGTETYFIRARRSLATMRRLLAQVAGATNLEAALARHTPHPIDLNALVATRLDEARDTHPAQSFDCSVEGDSSRYNVRGEADALGQMFDKLTGNALEHRAPGTPISIELRLLDDGRRCTLAVVDEGDPLPDGDLDELFRPFVTGKKAPSAHGNLGLGLFVARTIAEHHGGTLEAGRLIAPHVGARLTVTLPLSPRAP